VFLAILSVCFSFFFLFLLCRAVVSALGLINSARTVCVEHCLNVNHVLITVRKELNDDDDDDDDDDDENEHKQKINW